MKESNKKIIFSSILVVVLFVITIVAVSYAYFSYNLKIENEDNNSVKASTANISTEFVDGRVLTMENVLPGDTGTKTFTVTNTGTTDINFKIVVNEVENTFVNKDDLEVVIKEGDNVIKTTTFPSASGAISDTLTIKPSDKTKSYTITITYKDTLENQIEDSGKSISGKIFIEVV